MDNSQGIFGNWQQMVGDQTGADVPSGQDTGAQNSQDKNSTSNSELSGKERSPADNSRSDISKENVIEEMKSQDQMKKPKKLKLSERVQYYTATSSCRSPEVNPQTRRSNATNKKKLLVLLEQIVVYNNTPQATVNNNVENVNLFKHCGERSTSGDDIEQNSNHLFEQTPETNTTRGEIQQNSNDLFQQVHRINTTGDTINRNTDDLFEQGNVDEINDRDNFTEINQLLQIDQSQLLELHPEIDNIELSDINTTTLPEIPEETTSSETSGTQLSIEESIDRGTLVNNVSTSKDDRFDNLNIPNNIGNTSNKSEFIKNDDPTANAAKGNVSQIPSGTFDDYMQATCADQSEQLFLHNLVWSPEKMTNTIHLGEYNSKDTLDGLKHDDKMNVPANTSKLIDLNSPVVLCENSSTSFSIPSDQTQFNVLVDQQSPCMNMLDDASPETANSTSPGRWNQMIILMADEGLSTVTVDNMEQDKPALADKQDKPAATEPKKTKQVEPLVGKYFKSKFRIDLESKEYVVCTFCSEKISVELNEVVLHCKTCVHIVRKEKSAKFRFGCFACDYKSNQLSHLKRHLSAHLKYVPK
uniref:C2H2-type domain-containing protein n=1 Tax=Cacopsylla melanoneura TaxID=428564 RepID=A0A8D8X5S9_9HEMI